MRACIQTDAAWKASEVAGGGELTLCPACSAPTASCKGGQAEEREEWIRIIKALSASREKNGALEGVSNGVKEKRQRMTKAYRGRKRPAAEKRYR